MNNISSFTNEHTIEFKGKDNTGRFPLKEAAKSYFKKYDGGHGIHC